MQNLIEPHSKEIRDNNKIYIPSGKAKISFIDTDDIGEIISIILMKEGHMNQKYTITGSEAISYYQVAKVMSKILNRQILYANPGLLTFRKKIIQQGTKKEFANVMTVLYLTTRLGMANHVTNTAEKILHRKPKTIDTFIKNNINAWQ